MEKNSKNGSAETQQLLQTLKKEKEQLIDWSDPTQISHVFFHSLIVDPQKAFHSQQSQGYKDYMVTVEEFNRSIEQLYQNDFVLVNLNDLIQKDEQGNLSFNGLALPEGKKPLVLSQDDVSYYEYMDNSGFPSRLVVSNNNEIKNVYKENDKEEIGDFDMVPLIDAFVKKHPDFSYQGAKGTLALTGYNGVLGYRTSKSQYGDNEKTKKEIEEAKKVADQLKKDGWSFASHTWGHLNMTQASLEDVKKDNELWQQEVAPILGKTNILIYPFGADISDWQPYSAENQKFVYLKSQGFDIFCNVDASTPAWGQLGTDFYRNARINIDGIRFQSDLDGQNPILDPFINVHDVYDKEARESA
ncbi:hypothetical protein CHF36_04125 [Enterococcus faecium]|nr:hypothetical protein [Enterococcus faecium]